MTVVTGQVQDIGMAPLSGALIATAVEFRTSGDFVVAPESRSWPIVAGAVEVDLLPGPTRLTIQVGSHARDSFDVIVPEEPVTLARLVEDAFPWSPSVVSAVAAHRQAAERAVLDAEGWATSFGLSATASTLAPGSPATVTVTGDGPAYSVAFGVPQGAKGAKGDPGTTEWSGINGKPSTFPPAAHTHTAADTGAVARQGAATGLWIGTEATLPPTGTAGVLYVTY